MVLATISIPVLTWLCRTVSSATFLNIAISSGSFWFLLVPSGSFWFLSGSFWFLRVAPFEIVVIPCSLQVSSLLGLWELGWVRYWSGNHVGQTAAGCGALSLCFNLMRFVNGFSMSQQRASPPSPGGPRRPVTGSAMGPGPSMGSSASRAPPAPPVSGRPAPAVPNRPDSSGGRAPPAPPSRPGTGTGLPPPMVPT